MRLLSNIAGALFAAGAACLTVGPAAAGSLEPAVSSLEHGALMGGVLQPRSGGSAAPFFTYYDRNFRAQAANVGTLPTCTAATSCVMQCYAETGDAWTCVDETGGAMTVTDGTGQATYLSPFGYALDDTTDASAPTLEPPPSAVNSALAPGSAWTVVLTGNSGEAGATSWMGWTFDGSTGDYIWMRNVGAGFQCRAGGVIPSVSPSGAYRGLKGGWGMHSCRWDGVNTLTVRAHGTQTSATGSYTAPGGTLVQYFGSSWLTPYPARGGIQSVTIFAEEKTDTEMARYETEWWGGVYEADDDPLDNPRAGEQYVIANGRAEHYHHSVGIMDATNGLSLDGGGNDANPAGSGFAADALDVTTWTDIGSPVETANAAAGLFADWKKGSGGTEMALVEDDDGAVGEGHSGTLNCGDAGTETGWFTMSCYAAAGSIDQMRVGITTNGTITSGAAECSHTGLTTYTGPGDVERYSCTMEIGGSPTSTKGYYLVGDDDTDTGTLYINQCQCEPRGHASNPKPIQVSTRAIAEDAWTIHADETATWPDGVTDGGDVEVVFKLPYAYPTYAQFTELFLDVHNNGAGAASSDHSMFLTLAYTTNVDPPSLKLATHDPVVAGADCHDAGASATDTEWTMAGALSADTWYVARGVYTPAGTSGGYPVVTHQLYFDTCSDPDTCHATTLRATGSDKCAPNGSFDTAYFGRRIGTNNRRTTGHIARFGVSGTTAGYTP